MKKNLFVFGMIVVSSTVAWAKEIGFDTPVKWNSKVIENALTSAGFIDSDGANWDVKTTRNRILENLLSRDMFSLHNAADVCMEKCNMSDFLKKGRGKSGKKCPELCTTFVENIIKENNKQYTSIPSAGKSDTSFSGLEDNSKNVCIKLASDAVNSGLSFPVLCGGTCNSRGDDIVQITDLEKTKEYKVDDFCDGQKSGDYFYIVSSNKQVKDVSSNNARYRIVLLKEAQTKPASDYMQEEKRQKYEQRVAPDKQAYAKALESNGYCMSGQSVSLHNSSCQKGARKYAQKCRCKLHSFVTGYSDDLVSVNPTPAVVTRCRVNDEAHNSSGNVGYFEEYKKYEYVPTYEDCVKTFNESACGANATYDYDCFEHVW